MVARIGSGWPLLLLGAWCVGRPPPVCPAVGGGGGTIPRSRAQVWGVFAGGRAHRAAVGLGGKWDSSGGGTGSGSRLMRSSPRQPGSLLPMRDTGASPAPVALPRVDTSATGVTPAESGVGTRPDRHQTTDLAVGGSNLSRRSSETAGQRPCGGAAAWCQIAGLRPNCDPIAGHSQHGCDHLRPYWPLPTPCC